MSPRPIVPLLCSLLLACGTETPEPISTATQSLSSIDFQDGFERQSAPQGSFVYQPPNSEWFFAGGGVKASQPMSGGGWLPAPEGQQQAFLQSGAGMHRMVSLVQGDHVLSFKLARGETQGGLRTVPVQVFVNGTLAGAVTTSGFNTYESQLFLIQGAGSTLVSIVNAAGGAEALIDDVRLFHPPSQRLVFTSGFEAPSTGGSFVFQPANTEWLAMAGGISQSAQMADGTWQAPHRGAQFGFLMSGGSLHRNVELRGGLYALRLHALRSPQLGGASSLPVEVFLDNQLVLTFTPPMQGTASTFTTFTDFIVLPAGRVPLRIANAAGAPLTFFDEVSLTRY